jgi:hypothetical protein
MAIFLRQPQSRIFNQVQAFAAQLAFTRIWFFFDS